MAPAIAGDGANFIPTLMVCLTVGLIWQFVLVLLLNGFSLRNLWRQRPSTSDGRRGGRLWLWALPFALGFGALQFVPFDLPTVANHDFGNFLAAKDGRDLLHGNWGLYVLILVMMTFNTVLGEELLGLPHEALAKRLDGHHHPLDTECRPRRGHPGPGARLARRTGEPPAAFGALGCRFR